MTALPEQSPPPFTWVGWYSWSAILKPSEEGEKFLQRTGAYAIAHSEQYPSGPPAPSAGCVVYIGETHREQRSLLIRLREFGTSAGFYGKPKGGHGAAWGWPEKTACACEGPKHWWVSLCPTPTELKRAARSVFPVAAEGHGLMEFAWQHNTLPALTNRERPGAGVNQPRPEIAEEDLQRLLGLEDDYPAAEAVAKAICQAWGDTTPGPSTPATYTDGRWTWNGMERRLADGWSMGVGWSVSKKHKVVDLWVSRQGSRHTFWRRAGSSDEFERLLEALSDWWWTA